MDEPKPARRHDTASQATSAAAGPVQGFDDPLEAAPDWVSGEEPPAGWVPSGMMDFADDPKDSNDMGASPTAAEAVTMGEKNPLGPPLEERRRNSNALGMPSGNHDSQPGKLRRRGRRWRKRGKRK